MGRAALPVGAGAGLLRHPADQPAAQRARALRSRCGGRVAGLREHAVPAAGRVLPRPAVAGDHRLVRRAVPLVRPGGADARGHQVRPDHPRRRGDEAGRRADGRGGDVPPDSGRRLLRTVGGGPVLRRCRACPGRLHTLRRVHDRVPVQRQEHPREELPVPRGEARRRRVPPAHGHGDTTGLDGAYQPPRVHRRPGGARRRGAGHAAAAARDEGARGVAVPVRPAGRVDAHQLRVDPRRQVAAPRRRLHRGRGHHQLVPPGRRYPHRAGAVRAGVGGDGAAADRARRRGHLAAGAVVDHVPARPAAQRADAVGTPVE